MGLIFFSNFFKYCLCFLNCLKMDFSPKNLFKNYPEIFPGFPLQSHWKLSIFPLSIWKGKYFPDFPEIIGKCPGKLSLGKYPLMVCWNVTQPLVSKHGVSYYRGAGVPKICHFRQIKLPRVLRSLLDLRGHSCAISASVASKWICASLCNLQIEAENWGCTIFMKFSPDHC